MKNIDLFAQPVKLHLKGKYKINIAAGGYITIITFLSMLLYV